MPTWMREIFRYGRQPWRLHACAVVCGAMWLTQAQAAGISKCRAANGAASYVSGACPAGQHTVWARDIATEDDTTQRDAIARTQQDTQRWQEAMRREGSQRSLRESRGATTRVSRGRDRNDTRCERARAQRDDVRRRDWMQMTYDRMLRLDAAVERACDGAE